MKTIRLSVGYGDSPILPRVELELRPGEFTVVIGPNASGKTTLLKTLAGILNPMGGAVVISGSELHRIRPGRRARLVGMVQTGRPDVAGMTVEEVVALGRYPWTGPVHMLSPYDRKIVEDAMKKTAIECLRDREVSELSDGQFQRVMIARALAQQPKTLILDEPTTHLDSRSRIEVFTLLRELARREGLIVIASTHEIELAFRFADRLIAITEKTLLSVDDPEEILTDERFLETFGFNHVLHLSPITLSVEYRGGEISPGRRVFIIAGSGTGARLYRTLTKVGFRISTGILHENDVDYFVARGLGLEVIPEKAYNPIGDFSYHLAKEALLGSDYVVFTNPPIGEMNVKNLTLLRDAVENDIPVFALDNLKEISVKGVEPVTSTRQLLEKIGTKNIKRGIRPPSITRLGSLKER
ncbi:putative siderophore transport system ATP-binding protein YusV [archaeon HR01]|nr:putative siderophore transport system ATP-binding protein YusV [archaeon HR01]